MLPFLQPTEVYTSPCPIPEELWLHTSFLWFAFILGESFHLLQGWRRFSLPDLP